MFSVLFTNVDVRVGLRPETRWYRVETNYCGPLGLRSDWRAFSYPNRLLALCHARETKPLARLRGRRLVTYA